MTELPIVHVDASKLAVPYRRKTPQQMIGFLQILASDQIEAKRWQTTARDRRDCDIRASTYLDAALLIAENMLPYPVPALHFGFPYEKEETASSTESDGGAEPESLSGEESEAAENP